MRSGIRGKLFLISVGLVVTVGTATGVYFEGRLSHTLSAHIEEELARSAAGARAALELNAAPLQTTAQAQPVVVKLGEALGVRITLIQADGGVLADSALDPAQVGELDNHSTRPEVKQALVTGVGSARRRSATLGRQMLYVARTHQADGLMVRVARPLESVAVAVAELRWLMLLIGLVALAVAMIMSALASFLVSRALRSLVEAARKVMAGGAPRPIQVEATDEVGVLADAFNELVARVQTKVDDLTDERDRFQAVLEAMDGAVVAVDGDGLISLMNPAAHVLLGVEADPVGAPLESAVEVEALVELMADAHQASEVGGATTAEFDLNRSPRRRVLARATRQPGTRGTVVVMHDVTELRHLERVRRDFVANVSHELRTPVSVIRANSETLLDGAMDNPPLARRFLDASLRNAERLSQLISDLLDISRIEAGRYHLELTDVALEEMVSRVVESVSSAAEDKQHEVTMAIPEELGLRADAKALEQVLTNLLENAIKYTQDVGQIRVSARHEGDAVRVDVRDNGPGIEPKYRPRVFERFYRVDKGRSREMGGTGLGLSIVKNLVEAMGGRVGVEPAQPHGSIFWFRLPPDRRGDTSDHAPITESEQVEVSISGD